MARAVVIQPLVRCLRSPRDHKGLASRVFVSADSNKGEMRALRQAVRRARQHFPLSPVQRIRGQEAVKKLNCGTRSTIAEWTNVGRLQV
jgi:hypothetical protein